MDESTDQAEWTRVETALGDDLTAIAQTVAGAYAVGDDGIVAAEGDDGWEIVVDSGPAGQNNNLTSLAVTDDRKRLWFAGESGALGSYDVEAGEKYDYTGPEERTTTLTSVAVDGDTGSERVHVGDDSGEVLTARVDGHDITWKRVVEPGSGDAITACTATAGDSYAVDGNGNAFRETVDRRSGNAGHHDGRPSGSQGDASSDSDGETDGQDGEADGQEGEADGQEGETDGGWTRIGLDAVDEVFHDVVSDGDWTFVAGNEGSVFRYDDQADNWTPLAVTDATIEAVALHGETVVALDQSKHVHRRTVGDETWQSRRLPMDEQPTDLVLGTTDIVVGDSGFVVCRGDGTADARSDGGYRVSLPIFERRLRRSRTVPRPIR